MVSWCYDMKSGINSVKDFIGEVKKTGIYLGKKARTWLEDKVVN